MRSLRSALRLRSLRLRRRISTKTKRLTIIVGYSPGGSFDLYARVIARYIGRYLPGNPTRIVENMTGAGGLIAANHLYNRGQAGRLDDRRMGVAVGVAAHHGQ